MNTQSPTKIVGVIASAEDARIVQANPQAADLYEFRADLAYSNPEVENAVKMLRERGKEIILTVRDYREGGGKPQGIMERIAVFEHYILLADFIDIEIAWLTAFGEPFQAFRKRHGVKIIASSHYFYDAAPDVLALEKIFAGSVSAAVDVLKIVASLETDQKLSAFTKDINSVKERYESWCGIKIVLKAMCKTCIPNPGISFAARPNAFVYGYLARPSTVGQWQVSTLRDKLRELHAV